MMFFMYGYLSIFVLFVVSCWLTIQQNSVTAVIQQGSGNVVTFTCPLNLHKVPNGSGFFCINTNLSFISCSLVAGYLRLVIAADNGRHSVFVL